MRLHYVVLGTEYFLSLIRIVHVGSSLDVFYCDTVFPGRYLHKEIHIHGSLHKDVITSLLSYHVFYSKSRKIRIKSGFFITFFISHFGYRELIIAEVHSVAIGTECPL